MFRLVFNAVHSLFSKSFITLHDLIKYRLSNKTGRMNIHIK